ncbi:hypothetical protein CQ020_05230 [Arthrobacter sp. MYb23]|uniref:DUF4192 domain-containing protein n=1 Tax=unclassified Arthrobacter TaxID=235627 RepID=UPI000CFB5E49|nr:MULTISPECIES: DUF4192 domain-containing protein [unclassified Arthrobacter]PRB42911.1 hypothetical protein CQ038_07860 [Arthrobacter sp. MYb51]PRB97864.1 hypothetical protein CQ020_05230 [Arthrobacter sp. MYb23]
MTSNRTLSIHQPEDILGYIPHMLGYWPEDSLVAITMQGKVLGATLRVDLPNLASLEARAGFADQIRSFLIADEEANGVVLAVYTDSGWEDGTVVRQAIPLLKALQLSLDEVDLSVRDAWLVGSEYWRSAYCTDLQCCPVPGLPVERIKNSRLSAELVYSGSSIGPSPRSALERPRLASPGAVDPLVLAAESRYGKQILGRWRSERCLDAILAVWHHVLNRVEAGRPLRSGEDARIMGFLRTTLRVPAWRDAVVVMAAAGMDSAKSGASAFGLFVDDDNDGNTPFDPQELGVEEPVAATAKVLPELSTDEDVFTYGDVLLGMRPDMPCWTALDALQTVLAGLCVDDESGVVPAAALTLQGWIAWCKGRGSIAHACLSGAEAAQPGYRLAELLMDLLGTGTICPWARSSSTAWRGYRDTVV